MAAKIQIPQLTCLRCGHIWVPRATEIHICPKCKSRKWDEPKQPKPTAVMKAQGPTLWERSLAEEGTLTNSPR